MTSEQAAIGENASVDKSCEEASQQPGVSCVEMNSGTTATRGGSIGAIIPQNLVFLSNPNGANSREMILAVCKDGKSVASGVKSPNFVQRQTSRVSATTVQPPPVFVIKPIPSIQHHDTPQRSASREVISSKTTEMPNVQPREQMLDEAKITKNIIRPIPMDSVVEVQKPVLKSSMVAISPDVKVEAEAAVVKITSENSFKPIRASPVASYGHKVDQRAGTLKQLLASESGTVQSVQKTKAIEQQAQKYGFEKILTSTKASVEPAPGMINDEFVRKQILINGLPVSNEHSMVMLHSGQAGMNPFDDGNIMKTLPGTSIEYRTPGATNMNKNGNVKRPMNAFMCWARTARQQICTSMPYASNADVSIKLGNVWSTLSAEQKKPFYDEAEQIKKAHREQHPGWTYRPQPKKRRNEETYSGPSLYKKWKMEQAANKAKEAKVTSGGFTYKTNNTPGKAKLNPLQYTLLAPSPSSSGGTVQAHQSGISTVTASPGEPVFRGRPPSTSIRTPGILLPSSLGSPMVSQTSESGTPEDNSAATVINTNQHGIPSEALPLDLTVNRNIKETSERLLNTQPLNNNIKELTEDHPEYVEVVEDVIEPNQVMIKLEDNLQISAEVEVNTCGSTGSLVTQPQGVIDTQMSEASAGVRSAVDVTDSFVEVSGDSSVLPINTIETKNLPVSGVISTGDNTDLNNNLKRFPSGPNDVCSMDDENRRYFRLSQSASNDSLTPKGNSSQSRAKTVEGGQSQVKETGSMKKPNWADVSTLVNNSRDVSEVYSDISDRETAGQTFTQSSVSEKKTDKTMFGHGMKLGNEDACERSMCNFVVYDPKLAGQARKSDQIISRDGLNYVGVNQSANPAKKPYDAYSIVVSSSSSGEKNGQYFTANLQPQVIAANPAMKNNGRHLDIQGNHLLQQQHPQFQLHGQNHVFVNAQSSHTSGKSGPLLLDASASDALQTPSSFSKDPYGQVHQFQNTKSENPVQNLGLHYTQIGSSRYGKSKPFNQKLAAPTSRNQVRNPDLCNTLINCTDMHRKVQPDATNAAAVSSWWKFPFSRHPYDDYLREQAVAANNKGEPFQPLPLPQPPQYGIKDLAEYDEDIPTSPPSLTQYDMSTARWLQPHTPNIPKLELNKWISYMNEEASPPHAATTAAPGCTDAERQRFRAFLHDSKPGGTSCQRLNFCSTNLLYPHTATQPYWTLPTQPTTNPCTQGMQGHSGMSPMQPVQSNPNIKPHFYVHTNN